MKKTVLTIMAMVMALTMQAQTIHWLTFIDTTDDNVGRIDILGRQVLYNRFVNVINAALAPAGYGSDIQDFYGTRTTPENCKNAVQNLKCGEKDIIVFYYIGHGTRAKSDPTPYPQMLLASTNIDKFIPLSWVNDQLKKKGARLAVTIGMCCNVVQDVTSKVSPTFSVNYGNTYVDDAAIKNIQKLFLENTGNIIISSASPSQSSIAIPVTTDIVPAGKYIDLFTTSLIHVFDHHLKNNKSITWKAVLDNLKEYVNDASIGRQTPIYEANINGAKRVEGKRNTEPDKNPIARGDSDDERLNRMVKMLDLIVDSNLKEEARMAGAALFKTAFLADGAEVKILSQDGDMVVDKESGITFIDRISTSRLLLKVAVESCKYISDGESVKIKEMRVREIYKTKDNK